MDRHTSHAVVGKRQERERGASTVEYVGIIIAVAVLIGALLVVFPSVGDSLADGAKTAVCKITGGDCSSGSGSNQAESSENNGTQPGQYANASNGGQQTTDPAFVSQAVKDLRDALAGGLFGVRSGDLEDARQVIEALGGAEIDALIAQMSDDELRQWVDQLNDSWLFGGWNASERRQLWELFASRASKDTIDRLARFTDELQPSFNQVGGDSARDDPTSPANTGQYGELPHSLFTNGASPDDVSQGAIGDCWWIASMMAVAQANPQVIQDAITINPNGTYTVRLYDQNGNPVQVTVTPDMVLNPDGTPAFVDNNGQQVSGNYELWPMVLEKALALHYGEFADIEGGNASVGLSALTGLPSSNTDPGVLSAQDLRSVLDGGGAIGLSSLADGTHNPLYADTVPSAQRLRTGHAYYVSDVDVAAGTVTVVNPWGTAQYPPLTLTYDEFVSAFRQVRTNEVTK
ncbi:MAG: C2 family cysteine protease [Micrococcales bacterium]|nr:C2 family cysteine protease [Micrococcales bacterium]